MHVPGFDHGRTDRGGPVAFAPASTCRHAARTISSSGVPDVRRMASEDSDQLRPGFPAVHRLRDLDDPDEPVRAQMFSGVDPAYAIRELLEVLPLRRAQRVRLEEGDYRPKQVFAPADHETMQVLSVVVPAPIDRHLADSEGTAELLETHDALGALSHDELVKHLIASPVAASPPAATLADETD
jgi:hypothetical protein